MRNVKARGVILPPFTIYIKSHVCDWLEICKRDTRAAAEQFADEYMGKSELKGMAVRVADAKGQIILEEENV